MVLSDNIRGAALMAASMAAFVSNDALMKLASTDVSLFQALFIRGVIATAIIASIAAWRGQIFARFQRDDWKVLILRMIGEIGATLCFLTALFNMQLANVTAILQALPLAVTLGAAVFLHEPVGWRRWTAIAIGFIGVLVIIRPGSEGFNSYSMLAILSVAFVVLRDLSTRRLKAHVPSIFVAMTTSIAITTIGGVMCLTTEWRPIEVATVWPVAAAAGFLVFGYLFSVMTMRVGEISFVAPFRYTILIWAILLGIFLFGEYPDEWMLVGSAIIVGTGMYSFYRERIRGRSIPHRNRRP
jgi:drug/metabolite transporter (DMT)-like permease